MSVDLLDDVFDLPDDEADMNPDLAAWAREHETPVHTTKTGPRILGPCGLCTNQATTRCLRCERAVCTRHHHVMVGVCTRCTAEETPEKETHEPVDDEGFDDQRPRRHSELDIDWIE